LIACLGLGPAAGAEPPPIYKWVDSNGIAHYTTDPERIPKALRNKIRPLERAAQAAEPVPAPPAPAPHEPVREMTAASQTPEPGPIAPPTGEPSAPPMGEPSAPPMGEPSAPPTGEPSAPPTGEPIGSPTPAPTVPTPRQASPPPPSASESWATRDATPRLRRSAALLGDGNASPEELVALAAEREALDARIAATEAEIARDENLLKDLISDPALDAEVPLFDRPEFLEVSQRLPMLQAQLQELRDERAKLEIP